MPLLVFHCNYVCISCRFWDIQRQIMAWPWNLGQELFKVIENGTIQKIGYGFLCTFHSNNILYHFRQKARYYPKIAIFFTPLHSTPPLGGSRRSIVILFGIEQELSYREQIARQLRTQYVEGIYRPNYPVTLKSRLRITQGHCKRNHVDRSYTT